MNKTSIRFAGLLTGVLLVAGVRAQESSGSKPNATKQHKTTTHANSTARHSSTARKAAPPPLQTQKQKASYAIGLNIGKGLQKDSVDVDESALMRGVKDALSNSKPALSEEEIGAALAALRNGLEAKHEEQVRLEGQGNLKEGEAFLAANKAKEGVVALPSGLQYKILKEGTGPKPSAEDSVVCNYRGTLLNEKEFDSSYKRGEPASFPVNGVIPGWTEALQLMPVGSKWQLFVPPGLAYGARGAGPEIGPNATLIFEVELLSIQPKGQK